MSIRVGINGFGRIGRLVLRIISEKYPDIDVVAINDLVPSEDLAYLLKYDSVHGTFAQSVVADEEHIVINNKKILTFSKKDPEEIPWKDSKVDYVIESTGRFMDLEGANKHRKAGAKRVIISAPAKGAVPTFVMGVNEERYLPNTDFIVSNASCTTNCLAPLAKILLNHFGIEEGLMTTVHAMTAAQATVDSPSKKDRRGGRAASINIIPSTTGAAKAVGLCLPEVQGKLTGMAFRVPVSDVSVVDLTVRLTKATTYQNICNIIKEEASGAMQGIVVYCDNDVVSSDFIGHPASCIFDEKAGVSLNPHFHKLVAWYDNEMGYSYRIVDLLRYMVSKENT